MKIYTIGFTQKTAEDFFESLKESDVKTLIDIRLNNKSQLAGFAKGRDLKYFLRELCDIEYCYEPEFAPSPELLDDWKKDNASWEEYEKRYYEIMKSRSAESIFEEKYLATTRDGICFLCSENTPEHCHRRLLAEYLKDRVSKLAGSEITHI